MTKREIAVEIFSRMEDEDLINFNARPLQDEIFKDSIDLIESILSNYVIIQGQIIE